MTKKKNNFIAIRLPSERAATVRTRRWLGGVEDACLLAASLALSGMAIYVVLVMAGVFAEAWGVK